MDKPTQGAATGSPAPSSPAGLPQNIAPPLSPGGAGPSQRGTSQPGPSGVSYGRGYNKQLAASEPTRTQLQSVAERVRKLFRFNSQKSSEGLATEQLRQAPGSGDRGGSRPVHVVQGPGHKGQGFVPEPASVLDYDERSSTQTADRSSILSGERSSIFSDRPSDRTSLPSDRDRASNAAERVSGDRGSGSRLGAYIKNIMKSGGSTSQSAPKEQVTSAGSEAPAQYGGSQSTGHAAYLQTAIARPQIQLQQQYQLGSAPQSPLGAPSTALHGNPTSPQSAPPPPAEEAPLPPPSALAIQRMERDSNLLAICDELPSGMDRQFWRVEDYNLQQKMHSGYASAVYKAICRRSGQTVALKVYQPAKLHEISQFQLFREARLHAQLNHPNIVKLYAAFKHGSSVILVQEFADGGDLLQLLMKHGTRLSERRATQLVLQPLLRALYYLHSRFIVHRDVKLENILFTGREMTLKLADFGLCLNLREERSVTRAGTLDYMAPEVLKCPQKHKPYDNKERIDLAYTAAVDIWALGVVAYELLNGCPPFTCHDKKETERRILSGMLPEFVVDVSDMAREFVYTCLSRHSDERPTAWQLLRYQWIKTTARISTTNLMDSFTTGGRGHGADVGGRFADLEDLGEGRHGSPHRTSAPYTHTATPPGQPSSPWHNVMHLLGAGPSRMSPAQEQVPQHVMQSAAQAAAAALQPPVRQQQQPQLVSAAQAVQAAALTPPASHSPTATSHSSRPLHQISSTASPLVPASPVSPSPRPGSKGPLVPSILQQGRGSGAGAGRGSPSPVQVHATAPGGQAASPAGGSLPRKLDKSSSSPLSAAQAGSGAPSSSSRAAAPGSAAGPTAAPRVAALLPAVPPSASPDVSRDDPGDESDLASVKSGSTRRLDKSASSFSAGGPEPGRAAEVIREMFRTKAVSRRPGGSPSTSTQHSSSHAAGGPQHSPTAAQAQEGGVSHLLGELWREKDREKRRSTGRQGQASGEPGPEDVLPFTSPSMARTSTGNPPPDFNASTRSAGEPQTETLHDLLESLQLQRKARTAQQAQAAGLATSPTASQQRAAAAGPAAPAAHLPRSPSRPSPGGFQRSSHPAPTSVPLASESAYATAMDDTEGESSEPVARHVGRYLEPKTGEPEVGDEEDPEDELALLGDMSRNRKLGKSFSNPTKRPTTTDSMNKGNWQG